MTLDDFFFLFHFFLSLITRKATVRDKKIKYVIIARLFDLYAFSCDYLNLILHVIQSCNEEVGFGIIFFTYPVFQ